MSHIEILSNGTSVRRRDIVDDLKDMVRRYEFFEDENSRLTKEWQDQNQQIERLKVQNMQLMVALGRQVWKQMASSAMSQKANKRKWNSK